MLTHAYIDYIQVYIEIDAVYIDESLTAAFI
jgi:hypothetical protein